MAIDSGMIRPDIQALPVIRDRMTFLYLERCSISRQDSAILARDEKGTIQIPAASLSALLLGPGTSVTHRGMELIGDCGVTVIWVGEQGVRYYASGRPLTHKADLLLKQAKLVCNVKLHLAVARKMYEMRFPDEDVSKLTMQQLRGREGARVRTVYRRYAKQWGVRWDGRSFDPNRFDDGSPINQALSAGHACLYGLSHAIIDALGCSAGLGFVHVGHENSFVYDIADLYKADITIPLAFEVAATEVKDFGSVMRRKTRDAMLKYRLVEKMVRDIHSLLSESSEQNDGDVVYLWNEDGKLVQSGQSHGK